jgi:hypothetical protein
VTRDRRLLACGCDLLRCIRWCVWSSSEERIWSVLQVHNHPLRIPLQLCCLLTSLPQPLPRNVQCARDAVGRVQGASLRALVALSPHAKRDARFVYLIIPQETDIDRFHEALQWAIASLYQPPSFLRGETWNHSSMMYDPCSPVSGTSSLRATPRNASQSFEAVAVGRCCCCCSPLLLLYISHYFQTLHNQLTLDTR